MSEKSEQTDAPQPTQPIIPQGRDYLTWGDVAAILSWLGPHVIEHTAATVDGELLRSYTIRRQNGKLWLEMSTDKEPQP